MKIALLCIFSLLFIEQGYSEPMIKFDPSVKKILKSSITGKMYRYEKKEIQLLNKNNGRSKMQEMVRYLDAPINLSDPKYQFVNTVQIVSEFDPTSSLDIDLNAGNMFLSKGFSAYSDNYETPNLLKGEKAQAAAIRHLRNLGLHPKNAEIAAIDIGGLNMAMRYEDGTTEDFDKLTTVTFERKLDGMPVVGASRIVIRLAEYGNLHGIVYNWPEFKKIEVMPEDIIDSDIDQTVNNMIRGKAKKFRELTVLLKDVVLYDDGNGIVEPVVYSIGKGNIDYEDSDGTPRFLETNSETIVPLLKNSRLSLPSNE